MSDRVVLATFDPNGPRCEFHAIYAEHIWAGRSYFRMGWSQAGKPLTRDQDTLEPVNVVQANETMDDEVRTWYQLRASGFRLGVLDAHAFKPYLSKMTPLVLVDENGLPSTLQLVYGTPGYSKV
jgi:hypothetical protein